MTAIEIARVLVALAETNQLTRERYNALVAQLRR